MASHGTKRVLLIGSYRHPDIRSCEWFSGNEPSNAADYDIVLLDQEALRHLILNSIDEEARISLEDYRRWRRWIDRLRERLLKLLKSGGTIMAVAGDSRATFALNEHGFPVTLTNYDWRPLPVSFKREAGETIVVQDQRFARYMATVNTWNWIAYPDEDEQLSRELNDEHSKARVDVEIRPIAVNRQQLPIAATVCYTIYDAREQLGVSGELHLLPPPTTAPIETGLRILLEDICGIATSTSPPRFAIAMRVPGEDDFDTHRADLDREVVRVQEAIDDIENERARRRRFLALLYGKGIAELQDVAQDAFEELGLKTWDADPDVSDEFMLGNGETEALVEVKGHRKSAQKEDVRQIDESLDEYEKKFGRPTKGILIVNAWNELPLESRDQEKTQSFPNNVIVRAEAIDVALLTGVELYRALCAFWRGERTGQVIFGDLISAKGVVTLIPAE